MTEKKNPKYEKKVRLFSETMGLSPIGLRIKQAMIAIRGEEDVPKTRFGLSSLKQLHPSLSLKLWRKKQVVKNKVIITNLVNHIPTPVEEGWSVKTTQTLDFRGKHLTYNSHNGTDFSIPIGTRVVASAPGKVVCVKSEFNRGGLKIFIDHGHGLMTASVHLARALVEEGDIVERGQEIAISGYSGLDGFITFPWGVPHIHFNTWLNGVPIDPFPYAENNSLWMAGTLPLPLTRKTKSEKFKPSLYSEINVNAAIANCLTEKVRQRLNSIPDLEQRAAHTIIEMNYYPTRFPDYINVYSKTHPRKPLLDLPFKKEDFDGVVFLDEM